MWMKIVRNAEEDDAVVSVDDDVIEHGEEEDGDDYNGEPFVMWSRLMIFISL